MSNGTLQVRTIEEEIARFKKNVEESGLPQGATLSLMMNAYEAEKATSRNPDAKQDVETFHGYVAQIERLFTKSVEAVSAQKDLVRESVRRELQTKDSLISDLKEELEATKSTAEEAVALKAEVESLRSELASARKTIQALTVVRDSLPDAQTVAELTKRVAELEASNREKDRMIDILASIRKEPDTKPEAKVEADTTAEA